MEVIRKYDLNDPLLFRSYQKSNYVESFPYFLIENALTKQQTDSILNILSPYDLDTIDTEQYKNNEHLRWLYVTCNESESNSRYGITKYIPELKPYDDFIIQKCLAENKHIWNLDISSVITTKYLVYDVGAYSDWHSDGGFGVDAPNISDNIVWRKLSATIALSDDDDYSGGEFEMVISAHPSESYIKMKPSRGSILLYPPFTSHSISPVTRGIRKALVYWFCGPRWR